MFRHSAGLRLLGVDLDKRLVEQAKLPGMFRHSAGLRLLGVDLDPRLVELAEAARYVSPICWSPLLMIGSGSEAGGADRGYQVCFATFGASILEAVLWIRTGFNADPDPAFYLNADPDPAVYLNADPDPDSGSQNNADPDPGQNSSSQKLNFYINILKVRNGSKNIIAKV
jgi:hypothetical protein